MNGKVYLVGAGPGDPELLTLKALKILKRADIVLHDELVGAGILAFIPSTARIQNVGKRCGGKSTSQREINSLLIQYALLGLQVVRLKGGDPFIFGRGGEEMQALREAGIEVEVVPGITAALSAAAAIQIPLTYREISSSLVFLTGHHAVGASSDNWPDAETWRPDEVLRWAYANFQGDIAMASGFGAEGMVLMDIASRVHPNFRVFTLDTEFLFPETYDLIDRVEKRYGIRVERVFSPLTPEEQEQVHGPALWSRNPDRCCNLRKVEPFRNKLKELRAWITAIRRDQTVARGSARKLEWDAKFQLVKVNPIADWTSAMVWSYIRRHEVPYNPLHDRNYPVSDSHLAIAPTKQEEI